MSFASHMSGNIDHLTPFHDRVEPRRNSFNVNSLPRELDHEKRSNDVYVGHIPIDVDIHQLQAFFSKFGEIDRIFEGRKTTGGMKWAFISYINQEDTINLLQQAGRLGLAGSILNIRPRDKTSAMERERDRELRQSRSFHRDRSLPPQMMRPPMRNNGVSSKAFPPRFPENAGNQAWSPYPLLSKTLTVANIPPDYTPKDLYELFSDFGKAEGAFVYAFPDMKGRRVGEVGMATYLIAQKALETMDGRYIDGYALEVSYKPALPIPNGPYQVSPPTHADLPPLPMPAAVPRRSIWTAPAGPNAFMVPPIAPVASMPTQSHFQLWSMPNAPIPDPRAVEPPQATAGPVQTPAPEPSPPPPYSALPLIPEVDNPETFVGPIEPGVIDNVNAKIPYDPCNLFFKNLDDEVIATQRDLEKLCSEFGTVTSTFLATYPSQDGSAPPVSKGFGFVAFSKAQEAELAKEKLHGVMVGRKKLFVSYAEKKEDRQIRLKAYFANMEKITQVMRTDMVAKSDIGIEGSRLVQDQRPPRRGMFRSRDNTINEDISAPPSHPPTKQSPFRGQPRYSRGSPSRKSKGRRSKQDQPFMRFQYQEPSFIDVDFHEDFPPLPKSVKPTQSSTLQKLTQASTLVKEQLPISHESTASHQLEPSAFLSVDPTSSVGGESVTPQVEAVKNASDIEDLPSHGSSVYNTPAVPRAPPPSSAELSTAGNTAPSTPTGVYSRPRVTPQSLHDRLLHAHASLETLQEGRPFLHPRSAPISPLLPPLMDDLVRNWLPTEDRIPLRPLETTLSPVLFETVEKKDWTGISLIKT